MTADHCKWCSSPAHRKCGRIWLCVKHTRFEQMKRGAWTHRQDRVGYDDLESLLVELGPSMRCAPCGRSMAWTSAENASTVMTLQHDRSGKRRLICRACNTKHARFPDDTFYDCPKGHRRCTKCLEIKSETDFYLRRTTSQRESTCRTCYVSINAKHIASRDPSEWNAYMRDYRKRRSMAKAREAQR